MSSAPVSAAMASQAASTSTAPKTGATATDPALHKAATQFEAIFIRQMLAAAHQTHFDKDLFSSQGLDTFTDMQDQKMADIAAQRDVLGLAGTIEAALKARAGTTTTTPATGGTTP